MTVSEQAPAATEAGTSGVDTVTLAKQLLAQSALRQRLFRGLFPQPSWDMLLCLYVALDERAELTQKVVCALSGEPFAQARRSLREMEQNGLVTRRADPRAGETMIEITDEAASSVARLLQDLAAGLHLVGSDAEPHPLRSSAPASLIDSLQNGVINSESD